MSCSSGEQAHILEAFFKNQADHNICDKNCEPAPGSSAQCRFILAKCRQRLRFEDLNKVYSKCDANPSYCDVGNMDKNELTLNSPFQLEYTCLSEKAAINPCNSSSRKTTNASLLLPLQKDACRALCEITPSNAPADITFTYNFLRNSNFGYAIIKYSIIHVNSSGKPPTWKTLDGSSYYQDGTIIRNVEKIVISFYVPQPKSVTRLWVYFSGAKVSVSCNPTEGTGTSTRNSRIPTQPETTASHVTTGLPPTSDSTGPSTVSVSTQRPYDNITQGAMSSNEDSRQETELIVGVVAVAVVVGVSAVVVVVLKRKRMSESPVPSVSFSRRGEQAPASNSKTNGDGTVPVNSPNTSSPAATDGDYGDYADCVPAPNTTGPRRDPSFQPEEEPIMTPTRQDDMGDEYGHLQHGRPVTAPSAGSEIYDHTTLGRADDVYNTLRREQKRQVVVDNVYSCTSP
ncbi:hypothetical protein BaRGS_00021028 [Batillaria attramentaria]|uniref:Uncharacterized protein n=1 Tax=Batillaria attramentaria TaxID=370345 RepID=A0ABD0KL88_9CAEN